MELQRHPIAIGSARHALLAFITALLPRHLSLSCLASTTLAVVCCGHHAHTVCNTCVPHGARERRTVQLGKTLSCSK
eukprot:4883966-Amphidinium_carterae.1